MLHGRGQSLEPPKERRQLRRIPRVLGSSFHLVWEAAPGRFLASLAPQAVSAVVTGSQLVVTRDLIAAVLATQSGGSLDRVTLLLALTIGLSIASSVANLVQGQQQQMLGAIVERHTNSVLLDRIIAIDLKRFETPEFQDLLRRAQNAMGRMLGVTSATIGLARASSSSSASPRRSTCSSRSCSCSRSSASSRCGSRPSHRAGRCTAGGDR